MIPDLDWRQVVAWFGAFALVAAAVLALPVVAIPAGLVGTVLPTVLVPVLALSAAAVGAWTLLAGDDPERPRPRPRRRDARGAATVGADVDEAFERLAASSDANARERRTAAFRLQRQLRSVVWTALEERGHSPGEVERLVDGGDWTDDVRAGAFLGSRQVPLRTRVRDWASGQRRRRQAEAATEEVAELADVELEVET